MHRRILMVAVAGVIMGAVACVPPDAPPTATTSTTTTTTTTTVDPNECEIEFRTIRTALLAYFVTNGNWPAALDVLVTDGWLAGPPTYDWDYEVVGGEYVLTGPC